MKKLSLILFYVGVIWFFLGGITVISVNIYLGNFSPSFIQFLWAHTALGLVLLWTWRCRHD